MHLACVCSLCELSAERENAATPTLEAMEASFELNDSVISEVSGYEGDREDEESFFWNGEAFWMYDTVLTD